MPDEQVVYVVVTLLTADHRVLGRTTIPCRYDEARSQLFAVHTHATLTIERDGDATQADLYVPADLVGCLVPVGPAPVLTGQPYTMAWEGREVLNVNRAPHRPGDIRIEVPPGQVLAWDPRLVH